MHKRRFNVVACDEVALAHLQGNQARKKKASRMVDTLTFTMAILLQNVSHTICK